MNLHHAHLVAVFLPEQSHGPAGLGLVDAHIRLGQHGAVGGDRFGHHLLHLIELVLGQGLIVTEIEGYVHSLGFFRNKARSLKGLGAALIERHDGEVPGDRESLVALPGVGRKTANVILGTWFGEPAITVDTHVGRLTHKRLELTPHTDPVKIEFDLMKLFPQKLWTELSHALIWHGRGPCPARKPRCESCVLSNDCPHPLRERLRK